MMGYYSSFYKEDWRGFGGIITKETNEGDSIILLPGYIQKPFDYYYNSTEDGTFKFGAKNRDDIESILKTREHGKLFFIVTGDINAANPEGDAMEWIQGNTQYAGQHTGIYLFTLELNHNE